MNEKPKLLALDDEQDNLDLISRSLRKEFEVFSTTSAKEALIKLEQNNFSVILSDQRMPEMSGTSFFEESIKKQPWAIRILITGYSDINSVVDAINKGSVNRYLKKPWTKDELQQEIASSFQIQKLVIENQEMVKLLQETNEKLQEQQKFLLKDLDERSKDLYTLNQKLQALNEQLVGETKIDGLTGLLNHKAFQSELRKEVERADKTKSSVSLLFVDVDHFKHFNDNHGHQAGDHVLRTIAQLLTKTSRTESLPDRAPDIVCRYGGEEFAIILPYTTVEGAKIKAERIRKSIAEFPFPSGELQPLGHVSVSIGVSTLPTEATTPEMLITYADNAMYASKAMGRNRITVYKDIQDQFQ